MPPSPSARFAARDMSVLRHVALYGIGLPAIVSRLFFSGKQSGHVLNRFSEASGPLIRYPRSLPSGLSYYRLSQKGVGLLSVSKDKAEPLGATALDLQIGIAFFCCLGSSRRHRVERRDLLPIFGERDAPQGNVAHILSDESGHGSVIYRVYQAQGGAAQAIQKTREHIQSAQAAPTLRLWLESGLYGMAILAPTSDKAKHLADQVRRRDLENLCPILIGVGPTAATLALELRGLRS
jgi:hypothetical protein